MAARALKRRRLTPPESREEGSKSSSSGIQKQFFKNAASWDLEQDYETKPRKGKKKEKENKRLPIKTADGRIEQFRLLEDNAASDASDGDWLEGEDGQDGDVDQAEDADAIAHEPSVPEREQILEAQEELAKIAVALNEEPEENVAAFKALCKIGQSKVLAVQKLTLVTQMAVYKDLIPGYRIRPMSEEAQKEKVSKEVRRVQNYEQSLVAGYQAYVKELTKFAKSNDHNSKGSGQSISSVAITCACTLVTAVPHFNFRGDLLKILVGRLSRRRVDDDFIRCRQALETLVREDESGAPSFDAVSLLSKMMRAREYQVDESVLNLFLHLRLLSEFSGTASQDRVDLQNGRPAKKSYKKEFRTKREKKTIKEQKELEKAMAQADATVAHEEREKMQSETLKLVFATYFRILKMRQPHLMGAVLEGLAKYAHLINQDFFGDLLEALKDLIRHSDRDQDPGEENAEEEGQDDEEDTVVRNTSREALLCTVTAFALLAGQDAHNSRSQLHLDLSFFTQHLYQSLFPLCTAPDLEFTSKSLRLADPATRPNTGAATQDNRVNLQTTTVLLVRCLTAVLLPPWNIRSVPPLRLAAFTKQLMSASLHVPEKSCQATLALLGDVMHTHGKKVVALWNTEERRGDGTFNPLSASVEGSNPLASTVWEGEILRMHFSPKVREGVKILEKSVAGVGS
jgi:nucleolar complex protein 3